jgi:ketosteroid isomerase-like protein
MVTTTTTAAQETDEFHAQAERWVTAFTEGWRAPTGPQAFADHFRSRLSPDVRLIQPQLPLVIGHRGFEERFVRPLFELVPDIRGEVERWAAGGDTVYIELTMHGSIAGRPLSWRVCDRVTLRDGVAIERESYFDPGPLIAAIARAPRAWPKFLRIQASTLGARIAERRKS